MFDSNKLDLDDKAYIARCDYFKFGECLIKGGFCFNEPINNIAHIIIV